MCCKLPKVSKTSYLSLRLLVFQPSEKPNRRTSVKSYKESSSAAGDVDDQVFIQFHINDVVLYSVLDDF